MELSESPAVHAKEEALVEWYQYSIEKDIRDLQKQMSMIDDRGRPQRRMAFKDCQGRRQNMPVGRSESVPPERSLASVNVRASCSGEVSQRQAGSRLGG